MNATTMEGHLSLTLPPSRIAATLLAVSSALAVLLITVGFLAVAIPATRAGRVDPMTALRSE